MLIVPVSDNQIKKLKKAKSSLNDNELVFLNLFNELKLKIRDGFKRKHKTLSETARNNFAKLEQTGFSYEDYAHAITAMLYSEWPKKTGNDNPEHLLVEQNFLKYTNIEDIKQVQNGNESNTIESAKQRNIDQAKQRDIDRHIRIYGEPPIEEGISYP